MIERITAPQSPETELRRAGLSPRPWSAGPDTNFAPHRHPSPKRLFVLRGSIEFDGLLLNAGDGIRISAGHEHSALVGADGVECVEAFEER